MPRATSAISETKPVEATENGWLRVIPARMSARFWGPSEKIRPRPKTKSGEGGGHRLAVGRGEGVGDNGRISRHLDLHQLHLIDIRLVMRPALI